MRRNISMYKASRYNTLIPLTGGRTLAYCGITGALAVWDEAERGVYGLTARGGADNAEALGAADSERHLSTMLENLEKGRFVVEEAFDERKLVDRLVNLARYDASAASVTIAPTLACNFACDYCYQNDEARLGPMSAETMRRTVAFVKERAAGTRGVHIAWYGGEPLLAAEAVFSMSDELVAHCAAHHIAYSAGIVTNGWLLTRPMAERLVSAKVTHAQVTLDGDRAWHDRRRILRDGGPTFDRILGNIAGAVEVEGFAVTVRVNIDRRNSDGAEDLLRRLREAGLSGRKNFGVYFAPVDVCSRECLRVADEVMDPREYARVEAELMRKAVEAELACASLPGRLFSLCSAVTPNGFVVLPDGAVHKCWNTVSDPSMKVWELGRPGSPEDSPLYASWTSDPLFASEACEACGILPNCTGGCANKTRAGLGSPCISLKHNMRERLLLYAISQRAITWEDIEDMDCGALSDEEMKAAAGGNGGASPCRRYVPRWPNPFECGEYFGPLY